SITTAECSTRPHSLYLFIYRDPATSDFSTLSLHDALPISHIVLLLIHHFIRRSDCPFRIGTAGKVKSVTGFDTAFFEHAEIPARPARLLDPERKVEYPVAPRRLPARTPRLGDLDERFPHLISITDAHGCFIHLCNRQVLTVAARRNVNPELMPPVRIMFRRIRERRLLRSAMVFLVSHIITCKTRFG